MGIKGRPSPQAKRIAVTHHPRRALCTNRKDAGGHCLVLKDPQKVVTFLLQAAAGQMSLCRPWRHSHSSRGCMPAFLPGTAQESAIIPHSLGPAGIVLPRQERQCPATWLVPRCLGGGLRWLMHFKHSIAPKLIFLYYCQEVSQPYI